MPSVSRLGGELLLAELICKKAPNKCLENGSVVSSKDKAYGECERLRVTWHKRFSTLEWAFQTLE